MSNEHTPGPWIVDATPQHCPSLFTIRAKASRCDAWVPVASVHGERKGSDAALISAAPELLEALDYLLAQTVDMDLKHGICLSEGEQEARSKALAAIAKAKGEL